MNAIETIPAAEPAQLVAGDSAKWSRADLREIYPAPDYALAFVLVGPGGVPTTINADAAGLFAISAAASAALAPGRYRWQLAALKPATQERATIAAGELALVPGFAGLQAGADVRSHAQKVLASLEAAIELRATETDLETELPDGRRVRSMSHAELIAAREHYRRELAREDRAAAIAKGQAAPRSVVVRL